MEHSPFMRQARSILSSFKNKPASVEDRRESAIELASCILQEARRVQTHTEKRRQAQLARMMDDPIGKIFTTSMTDQCFRTDNVARISDQMHHLIDKYGVPNYLSFDKKLGLNLFKYAGYHFPRVSVPLTKQMLRQETRTVILPGEMKELISHVKKREEEGVRVNLNHLGEAILGEEESESRLNIYLEDLTKPEIDYVSVKISTIYSQINLLAWNETLEALAKRLRQLYRAAKVTNSETQEVKYKFINLDMEEYRDLRLTVDLFKKVLSEPEFKDLPAGIVLQSYLPDSFMIQQELTEWAKQRYQEGGAPIKIRLVKGANLAMEQVEAALKLWPQAPYTTKAEVDANYKRMLVYGCQQSNAQAAHLGIGSHNLFDIAYALLLRAENDVEPYVCFEMLEGMANHMQRVVQKLAGEMVLYCPVATDEEFQNAVAYLVRRLDENTAPENFLRNAFDLIPGTRQWQTQTTLFSMSCRYAQLVSALPRRTQNRLQEPIKPELCSPFENEPDTDWSLEANRQWAQQIVQDWQTKKIQDIPLVIDGQEKLVEDQEFGAGFDPSQEHKLYYRYALASSDQINQALEAAEKAKTQWSQTSVQDRSMLLAEVAHQFRLNRNELIGAMIADTGKTIAEADVEISEAIDFAEYYRRNLEEISLLQNIEWTPKGTVLVTPPWNFPCSIPAGGILAALAAGNVVLFKPAPEAVLIGWITAELFWKAGVPKDVLQFINCADEPIGSELIRDLRVSTVVLTGATATARLFFNLRPDLDLLAETGGKNAIIVSAMADRDLAVKDIVQSAFGHAGQKCSACSLVVCEEEVYHSPLFRKQLRDAAASLSVGSAWDPRTKVNPLIRQPHPTLYRALTQLDEGEEWLLKPEPKEGQPNLWSPGIKLGVKPSSFTHQTEFFGPVLGIMCAKNLDEAIEIVNQTPYGLTSGLHSLDTREQLHWQERIIAGNCYINRSITGAVVQRQPFGGCKNSGFGPGAKAGGPNYLMQLMHAKSKEAPFEKELLRPSLLELTRLLQTQPVNEAELTLWEATLSNYEFFWKNYFSKMQDPSQVRGQDNFLKYTPYSEILFRIQPTDSMIDILGVIAAATICEAPLTISVNPGSLNLEFDSKLFPKLRIVEETQEAFGQKIASLPPQRVRLLQPADSQLTNILGAAGSSVIIGKPIANGRVELVKYLREMSLSIDYHRYGNLGDRENEERKPLPMGSYLFAPSNSCGANCACSKN